MSFLQELSDRYKKAIPRPAKYIVEWNREKLLKYFAQSADAKLSSVKLLVNVESEPGFGAKGYVSVKGTDYSNLKYCEKHRQIMNRTEFEPPTKSAIPTHSITIVQDLIEFLRKDMGEPSQYDQISIVYSWGPKIEV